MYGIYQYLERLSSNISSKKTTETTETSSYPPIPPCFKTTLQPFMLRLRTEIHSPDVRICLVACNYSSIMKATVGVEDEWGTAYFSRILGPTMCRYESTSASNNAIESDGSKQATSVKAKSDSLANLTLNELLAETEDLLRQLDSGSYDPQAFTQNEDLSPTPNLPCILKDSAKINGVASPANPSHASLIIILQVVFSSVRHVRRTSSKFIALKLMHRIALYSSDEIRLERIVPFITSLLLDSEAIIRALAITILTSVLSLVRTFPPSDAQLFPRYVFKKVAHLITDTSLIVRVAFARNIATLSETSLRFLDIGHAVSLYDAVSGTVSRADEEDMAPVFSEDTANLLGTGVSPEKKESNPSSEEDNGTVLIRNTYDSDLAALHEVVLRWVVHITTDASDHSSQSKQALLKDLPRLCNFFGTEYSFNILPQILAFFNDRKDWQLRASVCRHLPTICVVVGRAATEQFVVPCIESALNDDEEQVVVAALACLTTLISASLLSRASLLGSEASPASHYTDGRPRREKPGVIKKSAALLLHPKDSIRRSTASFIFYCWKHLGPIDTHAFTSKILLPYLQYNPSFESLEHLISCLKAPTTSPGPAGEKSKSEMTTMDINGEIEFSVKLARSFSVPSQWLNEPTSPSMPIWYESLQRLALSNSQVIDPCFSLGLKAVGQGESYCFFMDSLFLIDLNSFMPRCVVYGINIPFSSQPTNQQLVTSWLKDKDLASISKDDAELKTFLSRPEVSFE